MITGSLNCGGAQRVLCDMANYWAGRNRSVSVATWSGSQIADFYPLAPNIARIWLDVASSGNSWFNTLRTTVSRIFKLRRWLRAASIDIVLSFIDVSNVHVILAAAGLGVRVVVCERTHPGVNTTVSMPWRVLRRISYRWAGQVVAQTRDAARWIEQECSVKVIVIPNAIRVLPQVVCARGPLIVGVGRLAPEKGFDLLLRAFAVVVPAFPDWRMALIGDGPQRQTLVALCEQLGIVNRVQFVGETQEVENWMARAGLVVQPSRREGFPNAVMEAMSLGAAVVCADCRAGPSELITNGINGRLVPVDDVAVLARVISELIQDPDLRLQLGREAEKIRRRYEPEVIMKQWEACLWSNSPSFID